MPPSVGTDIVSVARIRRLIQAHGLKFLARWFTSAEIAYCQAKAEPARHFAARLAAKESVVKALRLTWDGPIPWRDIEIRADETGAPQVRLHGALSLSVSRVTVPAIEVSLSHCANYATAVALLSDRGPGDVTRPH